MTDQLFDAGGPVRTGTRRHQPAPVKTCAIPGCNNIRRPGIQGAKYCDEHATSHNYVVSGLKKTNCYVCDVAISVRWRGQNSLYFCRDHKHLAVLLKTWRLRYNINQAQARKLLDKPTCWICGQSLAWRFESKAVREGAERSVHVDHDHGCCEGQKSCGRCIRGLTHENCNRELGHVESLLRRVGPARTHEIVETLTSGVEQPNPQ